MSEQGLRIALFVAIAVLLVSWAIVLPLLKREGAEIIHYRCDQVDVVSVRNLSIGVFEEAGTWYAQCIEIDHMAEGRTKQDAEEALMSALPVAMERCINKHGRLDALLARPVLFSMPWRSTKRELHVILTTDEPEKNEGSLVRYQFQGGEWKSYLADSQAPPTLH